MEDCRGMHATSSRRGTRGSSGIVIAPVSQSHGDEAHWQTGGVLQPGSAAQLYRDLSRYNDHGADESEKLQ
eukprot:1371614-Rhodomonas_salina.1